MSRLLKRITQEPELQHCDTPQLVDYGTPRVDYHDTTDTTARGSNDIVEDKRNLDTMDLGSNATAGPNNYRRGVRTHLQPIG